jgi:hypothetical protein
MNSEDKNKLLHPTIQAYYKEYMSDATLNDLNIKEKSLELPGIKSKWWMYFYREKAILKKLTTLYDTKVQQYIMNNETRGAPIHRLKIQANNDPAIKDIKTKLESQQEIVEYLEGMAKLASSISYDITNITNQLKMESIY